MKVFSALMVLSTLYVQSAHATQARLIALGLDELDNEGSYYIEDSRNIFLNPAFVNRYGDLALVELGGTGKTVSSASTTNTTLDDDYFAKAQGGFLKRSGDFVYGAYFGNESTTASFLRIAATSNAAALNGSGSAGQMLPTTDNQLEVFAGSKLDSGMEWGWNFVYLNNEDKTGTKNQTDKAMATRFGAIGSNWDAHLNLSLANTGKNTVTADPGIGSATINQEFKGKFGVHAGGSYKLGVNSLYGFYKTFSWQQKDDYASYGSFVGGLAGKQGKQGTNDAKFDTLSLGWGRVEKMGAGSLFTNLQLKKVNVELELASKVEVNSTTIPLTVGYEVPASEWLTLRGSVTQNVYGKRDNKNYNSANVVVKSLAEAVYGPQGKGDAPNSTRVDAGASMTFGKLVIDGTLGTVSKTSTQAKDATLRMDSLFTRAAISYNF
ncbi:MAG: hypothetical protein Fur0010_19810 [Bdellovibrio sp.]